MIPEEILDQIQDRTDIVEVISGYVPLKRAGRSYKGLCPFHHEKTPSFIVNPDKGIFHCFGCGVGGNVFSFLMKYENIDFPEAANLLAEKAGVTIPRPEHQESGRESFYAELFRINQKAADFFHATLLKNTVALAYLEQRGVTRQAMSTFQVGYAPSGWEGLLRVATSQGFQKKVLAASGLFIEKEDGRLLDRFRNRIMFPIRDIRNRVVGFGARTLSTDKNVPKYINSPETPIYTKGKVLYGLDLTKEDIRGADTVIVVEGYLDMITPFMNGIKTIVASLGTALTEDQVKLMGRFTRNAVLIFDSDKAGQLATIRGIEILWSTAPDVRVAMLPKGYDPDSFVRTYGADRMRELIADAKDFFDFLVQFAFEQYNPRQPAHLTKICDLILSAVAKVDNAILQNVYIKKLSSLVDVEEHALRQEIGKITAVQRKETQEGVSAGRRMNAENQTEKMLLSFVLSDARYLEETKKRIVLDDIRSAHTREVLECCYKAYECGEAISPQRLINRLSNDGARRLLTELASGEYVADDETVDRERVFLDCLAALERSSLERRMKGLQHDIKLAQVNHDEEGMERLLLEFQRAVKQLRHLK
ncbi:MAG: DNA primase [Candidatus Omnitrophica bacterium]|nr:DNA primase [Candidatus Omnitrophota bacterium]